MSGLKPHKVDKYHIFLASPGDMGAERQAVRGFFEEYNRYTESNQGVHFTVIDWENYATAGVGRPQQLITSQTVARFRPSLALVIGLMGQRFGIPSGTHESGTEEEFEWALQNYLKTGFPEIKWFFRKLDHFTAPSVDPRKIQTALEQWTKVLNFKQRLQRGRPGDKEPRVFYKEFTDLDDFRAILRNDLSLWLSAPERPWISAHQAVVEASRSDDQLSPKYYANIVEDFQWFDIAGIDNDRAFRIPLSDMYVRLRVMLDEDSHAEEDKAHDGAPIDIRVALERYRYLVVVGDPGSGKSTFLHFIALMIARSVLEDSPYLASEKLGLETPLPIPIFISLWDLSDLIRQRERLTLEVLVEFIQERFALMGSEIADTALSKWLEDGACALLLDGLDEVPTEQGRGLVSRLVEDCVKTYPKNRYVITSRIRAYTGDTILRGEFSRCDIQEFNRGDRTEFLRNWIALLMRTSREAVTAPGSESVKELENLSSAIEHGDRIRTLATNPLLLTVIAIVHWNRKRLPEQRVELYDECVDVLLGQRKEAEWTQTSKRTDVLNEQQEEKMHDDRAWVRKRFSEIALHILRSDDEEISRQRVVALLRLRFLDRGAKNQEQADLQAERFLDRQELRSGLLVSRRSNSYRFVHLTFQEYLAAWSLASQALEDVIGIIQPHLREQKWFEPLQLLGGEWAKRSDEILNAYISYLLQQQGKSIQERAPVIALCANTLNDIAGVAQIKSDTRKAYDSALADTLHAFDRTSGVPAVTQLEILQALGTLGHAVKDHLISATKSAHRTVRARAIDMLVPHLPDDDLFSMGHILSDRSQETVMRYLDSLLDRDPGRTLRMLASLQRIGPKVMKAILRLGPRFLALGSQVKESEVAAKFWELIAERARNEDGNAVRTDALELLAEGRKGDDATRELIHEQARSDVSPVVCSKAWSLLANDHELGDPRFHRDRWYLPNEPLLGFVPVSAGPFRMGSDRTRASAAYENEVPQHVLTLPLFYMARWPVTVDQFKSFVAATGYQPDDVNRLSGIGNHPMVEVTWHDAVAYCRWLGQKLHELAEDRLAAGYAQGNQGTKFWTGLAQRTLGVGLPSEAEWEKAARGVDGRIFPWGNHANNDRANYSGTGIGSTSAVGVFPRGASPYGCEDMSGNVWEWTRSLYGDYPYPSEDQERQAREDLSAGGMRVLRGGAFYNNPDDVPGAVRYGLEPDFRYYGIGFRLVVSPFL
jgi:formylglycine-generating enzyme required for sulfatase activity